MKSLYLLVDFFTVIVSILFSFHPKIKFYKTWGPFFIAAITVGILFVIWDSIFTGLGVWNFNPKYVTGIYFARLPIEEILFFICIPFSCVFTFFCLDKFYNLSWKRKTEDIFCIVFSITLLILGFIFLDRLYTSVTFISTALISLFLQFILKINWFGKAVTVYAILLVPFFIVNGILTGTGLEEPVVRYNPAENLNIRLLTIPVEDVFYGFEMILLNLFIYLKLTKNKFINRDQKAESNVTRQKKYYYEKDIANS
ncbi:MAG: lycopene cyclase domain-containing protein [Ginsengibacter sp.]